MCHRYVLWVECPIHLTLVWQYHITRTFLAVDIYSSMIFNKKKIRYKSYNLTTKKFKTLSHEESFFNLRIGSTFVSKNVTNHSRIFKPTIDTKTRSSITSCQKTLAHTISEKKPIPTMEIKLFDTKNCSSITLSQKTVVHT